MASNEFIRREILKAYEICEKSLVLNYGLFINITRKIIARQCKEQAELELLKYKGGVIFLLFLSVFLIFE